MKACLKLLTCFAIMAGTCGGYAEEMYSSSDTLLEDSTLDKCMKAKKKGHSCKKRARQRALEINAAIDQTFPLLVPETADQGAAAFTSFFAKNGVFQFPGGIVKGKDAIFATFKAYADNPGEMNQHVITRKAYWDAKTATLTVERTWFATVTVDTNFCGTIVKAGETYSQDDALIVRFECDPHSKRGCIFPGKVVYYHEYFDTCQIQSDFTSDYPKPCDQIGKK